MNCIYAESRGRVCHHADDGPQYDIVKSPVNERFEVLTTGTPQPTAATTNPLTRQPCGETNDHLQLLAVTTATTQRS